MTTTQTLTRPASWALPVRPIRPITDYVIDAGILTVEDPCRTPEACSADLERHHMQCHTTIRSRLTQAKRAVNAWAATHAPNGFDVGRLDLTMTGDVLAVSGHYTTAHTHYDPIATLVADAVSITRSTGAPVSLTIAGWETGDRLTIEAVVRVDGQDSWTAWLTLEPR